MTHIEKAHEWLEKTREWLQSFEGMPQTQDFQIDYNRNEGTNAGLNSNGLTIVRVDRDVLGNVSFQYQLNFALHVVFPKPPDHDELSTGNAAWVLGFQRWVIFENAFGVAPKFGDIDTEDEDIRAQGGMLYENPDDGEGLYAVTITINFKEHVKEAN